MAMKVEYINPIVDASKHVLKTTCNEDVEIGKLSIKTVPLKTEEVVILLGITGKVEGQVIFSLDLETAKNVASKMMMGMEVLELDEMAKSAICELSNMILGNSATEFFNAGIIADITPPSLLIGKDINVSTMKGDFVCIPLQLKSSGITFEVNVCMVENDKA